MARKPKFDPARHDENPEWTAADFVKAKPASEMPDKMLSFFKTTKAKLGRPPACATREERPGRDGRADGR